MRTSVLILCITCIQVLNSQAQEEKGRFVGNVGYLHSLTRVDISPGNLVGISDYYGKPGLYAGLDYEAIILKYILSRSEINYQNKGSVFDALQNGYIVKKTSVIHYISLRQLIGLLHLKQINLFVGPEINILASNREQNPNLENIEAGISGCISYRFGRLNLNFDYFRAINRYAHLGDNIQYFDLYNSNIRFGLGYSLSRAKYK